jgi:CDP-diacylglycerol--serine O-phosphatidyltransferase
VRKVAILPTLLTLGNAACGFAAIIWASKIDGTEGTESYFALSGWLIICAMLFDALDGYVARLARTASKFGGELDSLCDAISFGAAPAFLLLRLGPAREPRLLLHQMMVGIATLYMLCALLRLARFNVENTPDPASHKRFRGLPSPAAAGCLASLAILRGGELIDRMPGINHQLAVAVIELVATLVVLAVALLMVSRVPYPHLTRKILRGRRRFTHLIEVIVAGLVVWFTREIALVALFWAYGLGIPIRHTWLKSRRRDVRPVPAGFDDILPR